MWLSKIISKSSEPPRAERGKVTVSDGNVFEIGASVSDRSISSYTPYGFDSVPPVGEEIILMPSSDGQIALGTKVNRDDLKGGEIRLSSKGGATIVLKNDGSVIINSMIIDKNGVIRS